MIGSRCPNRGGAIIFHHAPPAIWRDAPLPLPPPYHPLPAYPQMVNALRHREDTRERVIAASQGLSEKGRGSTSGCTPSCGGTGYGAVTVAGVVATSSAHSS